MNQLYVLMGVPGSGKSTWARTFYGPSVASDNCFYRRGAGFGVEQVVTVPSYYSTDALRRELFGELTQDQGDLLFGVWHWMIYRDLRKGRSVIADSTALDKTTREQLLNLAYAAGAEAHLVWFKDYVSAIRRNGQRPWAQRVPDEAMERMLNKDRVAEFQVPVEPWDSVTLIEKFGP